MGPLEDAYRIPMGFYWPPIGLLQDSHEIRQDSSRNLQESDRTHIGPLEDASRIPVRFYRTPIGLLQYS